MGKSILWTIVVLLSASWIILATVSSFGSEDGEPGRRDKVVNGSALAVTILLLLIACWWEVLE